MTSKHRRTRALLLGGCLALAALSLGPRAAQAAAQERAYSIAAQPLAPALRAFALQSGEDIVFDPRLAAGKTAAAVNGQMSDEEALRRLLEGTGLAAERGPTGGFVVRQAAEAAPGRFQGQAPEPALDQVIVTAQKRAEPAQAVPITLTTFSAQQMEAYQLQSLGDIARLTPGLLVSAFNYTSPTIAIRGASNTFTQIGANKPVAVVLDDLFIPRNSAAVFDLYQISSLQVLKGPQGTLFGRNVTGGAIVIDTGRPDYGVTRAEVRGGVGDFSLVRVDGLVDAAAGDSAVRLAGSYISHSGYGRDRLTGRDEDDLDSKNLRGQVRLKARDDVEVLLGADYDEDHNGGRTLSSRAAGSDGDRRTSELGYPQDFARNQWGSSARVYWRPQWGEVTSITGYRRSQAGEDYSGTGASYVFLTGTNSQSVNRDVDHVSLLSQELRYASPSWGWGDFVTGVYLSRELATRQLRARTLAAVSGRVSSDVLTDQKVRTDSYGLFLDGVVHLPARFDLTLGGRYSHDEKVATLVRTDFVTPASGSFTGQGLTADWGEFTPRAILTWKASETARIYGSITRGYTAGGFNTDAATPAALAKPFDPETVTDYEIGFKSELFARRVRLNGAAFHMDYKNKQELFFNNLTRVLTITNAARATIKGVEVEATWRAASWLNLSATYGYLEGTYDQFVIPGGAIYTGNPLASSPRNKYSLAADVNYPVFSGFVTASVSWAYTNGYYTGASRDPNLHIDSYGLGNLTAGYATGDRRWKLLGWVKNFTNRDYVLTPSTQGVLAEYLGPPRTFGVSLEASF